LRVITPIYTDRQSRSEIAEWHTFFGNLGFLMPLSDKTATVQEINRHNRQKRKE